MQEQFLKRIPYWMFAAVTIKCLYFGFDWPTVAFLSLLGGVVAFMETNASNAIINDFKRKVDSLEERLNHAEREVGDMKTYISSSKLANIKLR
jgi:hypothetical protein